MYKVYADDELIYDSTLEDYKLAKGTVTLEADKAGSFVSAFFPGHPFYDRFVELRTVMTVYKSNRIKFRGRVLKVEDDYWNTRTITSEGELCFLQDSVVRPRSFTGTRAELFAFLIEQHNAQVDEFKQFKVGTVTVADAGISITCDLADYATTFEVLSSLPPEGSLAGHLYITHGDDGRDTIPTLHYLADYTKTASQGIEFGENLKDYTKKTSAEDVATVIIPLGAAVDDGNSETTDPPLTIAKVNGGKDYVESAAGVALRGRIVKKVEWKEITDAATLKAKAEEYVDTAISPNITVELTALDLHLLDRSIESYNVCEYIPVTSAPHSFAMTLLCNKQTLDLLKPDADTVTLGHTYSTFTEASNKTINRITSMGKTAGAVSSEVVVEIISRLEALEGVAVVIVVTDTRNEVTALLNTYGTLNVADQAITVDNTTQVIKGGSAVVTYTLKQSLIVARSVVVNGETLGEVRLTGEQVTITVPVKSGSSISIEFK